MMVVKHKMNKVTRYFSALKCLTLACVMAITFLVAAPRQAEAGGCTTCSEWVEQINAAFDAHKSWMTSEWWGDYLEPAMKSYTDQVRDSIATQAYLVGKMMDGQSLMGSMRTLQELNTETMKDYAVSSSICKFGTLSRSLAASQSNARLVQVVMSERSRDRQLGHDKMASEEGEQKDRLSRLERFRNDYCDPMDFNTGMRALCEDDDGGPDSRQNIDINFTRAIDTKKTLDVNFSDTAETDDEKDVIALANNLYAHSVFNRIDVGALDTDNVSDAQTSFMDQRAIVAKRSVAENSFNALVGQKAHGGNESKTYLVEVLKSLGLSATDAAKYVGENPSYDSQMEVLTKKLYQDPKFYANLMDSPANVDRQYAALQSFGLMQKRDIYETILRSEMLLSMLLEMEVSKYQSDIQNRQK